MSHEGTREVSLVQRPVSARRRALAVATLVLVPAGLVVVAFALVRGLPELLLAALALAAAALALWMAAARRAVARYAWLIVAVLALGGAAVLTFLSGRQVLVMLIGLGVMTLGLSAAGGALVHAPREGESVARRKLPRPQRPWLFVNPRSGDGTAERVGLVDVARRRGIQVVELGRDTDLVAEARRAVEEGADCLAAAGGDGTLAQVAEVAIEAGLPFVCVPAGTRNHFALDLGLDRTDPVGALDAFGDCVERRIDVAEVNGRMFLNNVSVGAYGEVVADEQYRQHKVGTALSKLPELIGPDAEPLDLRFRDPQDEEHTSAIVVHVSNNAYELAPRPGFGTRPSLRDGLLGVVVVVQGGVLRGPVRVMRWEAPEFTLDSDGPIAAGLDGEALTLDAPARFRIRAGVLRVRMPLHAPGASPSGRRPRLTRTTLEHLRLIAVGRPLPAR